MPGGAAVEVAAADAVVVGNAGTKAQRVGQHLVVREHGVRRYPQLRTRRVWTIKYTNY